MGTYEDLSMFGVIEVSRVVEECLSARDYRGVHKMETRYEEEYRPTSP